MSNYIEGTGGFSCTLLFSASLEIESGIYRNLCMYFGIYILMVIYGCLTLDKLFPILIYI